MRGFGIIIYPEEAMGCDTMFFSDGSKLHSCNEPVLPLVLREKVNEHGDFFRWLNVQTYFLMTGMTPCESKELHHVRLRLILGVKIIKI